MLFSRTDKTKMPTKEEALPGRDQAMPVAPKHFVLDAPLDAGFGEGEAFANAAVATFGMGCFWGAERKFWQTPGVLSTAAGYAAGHTKNPSYREVCSGKTGHNEVVRVVFDPQKVSYEELLRVFWENHNPTQGMRQGNDVGTQYRSGIYVQTEAQRQQAQASLAAYQEKLSAAGHPPITTEIVDAGPFYFAEDEHQQYLAKNPGGYCGLGGTGVACPIGLTA